MNRFPRHLTPDTWPLTWCLCAVVALLCCAASDLDEFKVKREAVFEFAQKPVVTRAGDQVTIEFETKGFCDVTVAIEEAAGAAPRIVRHLASGVLGPNAPAPFQKDSKKQTIVWDGKNDKGEYIDDKDKLTIRVSLGLEPRFERTLYWEPKKRFMNAELAPIIRAAGEGVYVYEGADLDNLRLFDHDGNYVRTVYPFRADRLDSIRDLRWFRFPQDGARLPVKGGVRQSTLLTCGENAGIGSGDFFAATAMAVCGERIALAKVTLNRLAADGSSGSRPLKGPRTSVSLKPHAFGTLKPVEVGPTGLAFSPDGRWLYLAGYRFRAPGHYDCLNGVLRLAFEGETAPEPFVGEMMKAGSDNSHFICATDVACDAGGRVYVSDHMNDRVQIFSPEGTFLKSVEVRRPARVSINMRTGELYVFSWAVANREELKRSTERMRAKQALEPIDPTLTRFGPFEKPERLASYPLPLRGYKGTHRENTGAAVLGAGYWAEVDGWADPPTVWLGRGHSTWYDGGAYDETGILLFVETDGELVVKRSFGKDTARSVVRGKPPSNARQRLYVNPKTGMLYVAEHVKGGLNGKACGELLQIGPDTGVVAAVTPPFSFEDLAFDADGHAYLRATNEIVRYDAATWQEVPWDYGESRKSAKFMTGHAADVRSALVLPRTATNWHMPGLTVSLTGHLAVAAYVYPARIQGKIRTDATHKAEENEMDFGEVRPWSPVLFPGRHVEKKAASIFVWDRYGRIVHEDALPGLPVLEGIGIDKDNNVYVLAAMWRLNDGKKMYHNDLTGTLLKASPKGKLVSWGRGCPLPLKTPPEGKPDLAAGGAGGLSTWVEKAEWFYGGVGYCAASTLTCSCWNCRWTLDYFARSFVPELDHYSVAVLDTNGNLVTRIGQYGNVDDGKPLILEGGPKNPRSIGGDEVALFYAAYLGTHTDRRLFIADPGNARIVSVKLDYHHTHRVSLKGVPETGLGGN